MPRVSVLMLFHRITPFFGQAVQSVLDQTFGDLELVLVDNGAATGLAPLGAAGRDPRIRLLTLSEGRGIPGAYGEAVAQARGDYLALLDYDDVALPTRIERQVALLDAHPAIGLVSSRVDTIDETGRIVGREFSLLQARDQAVYTQFANPVVTPAYTGRREAFVGIPMRRQFAVSYDFDWLARVAERWTLAGVNEVLLQYRRYPGQTTVVKHATMQVEICMIRLLTSRRRAGRGEEIDALRTEFGAWQLAPPNLTTLYLTFSRQFLTEGFSRMAAYHARKVLATSLAPRQVAAATRIAATAILAARREARLVASIFLRGPVAAYGLGRNTRPSLGTS